ncbi:hypothetical protein DYBT9275_01473 [Dyadobacter sp. CECT 9275]|uniref:4'-phosphopantetheinyl transferase domain-containing protein n=1 Tax=Dyadobacter helix TaxID=2822344 RepID=A0A916JC51_9BACT|nr:4'-phosphopantetheinyl transferase superfamily protein [Dyadobacter sp. CECT 9275]CAG4994815.1 hypothetical protein DYBT9275_01473 [Dyadobacter sp. CECT 9275]
MGIALTKKIGTEGILSLWQITETASELTEGLIAAEQEELATKKPFSEKRRKEWLATRQLLAHMMPVPEKICYQSNGKPYLLSGEYHVSISHSANYAALYLSKTRQTGVDIQQMRSSVIKGADFFMTEQEMIWAENGDVVVQNLIWSAKESVFKFFGDDSLNLKKDIKISRFVPEQFGKMQAYVFIREAQTAVSIGYEIIGDYVLTWTI